VGTWDGARALISATVGELGALDVLVNNAGIVDDQALDHITEEGWDKIVRVNLRGHALPTHFAANYWRQKYETNGTQTAALINTTSLAALRPSPGRSAYSCSKAGVAALTQVAALELEPYGVHCNAIATIARTPMTQSLGLADQFRTPDEGFDVYHPANISPLIAYFASKECSISGHVFVIVGGTIEVWAPWSRVASITQTERWTVEELQNRVPKLVASSNRTEEAVPPGSIVRMYLR
jgi:NAD(P)-dependent dehydrogenase (short-subunit alcohol dehydrogenase family)